jgi:hypothetical protein
MMVWQGCTAVIIPGRLDAAKAWLLQWEGLLVGGVAIGGISAIAVRVYSEERMDDLDR